MAQPTIRISWWQLTTLVVITKLAMLLSYAPILAPVVGPAHKVARNGWLAAPLAAGIAFLIAMLVYLLARNFPGLTVFEYSQILLGKYLGTALNLGIVLLMLDTAARALHLFTLFIKVTVLKLTPWGVIAGILMILCVRAVMSGFETIARVAEFLVPILLLVILLMFASLIPELDLGALQPVFADGFRPVFQQALSPIVIFGEASWVALLALPYLNRIQEGPKALGVGLGINAAVVGTGAVILLTLLGAPMVELLAFPTHTAARIMTLGTALQRPEWAIYPMWIGTLFIHIAQLLYGMTTGAGTILRLKDPRWLSIPFAILCLAWSVYVFPDITAVFQSFEPKYSLPRNLPLELGVPLLLLAALGVRKLLAGPGRVF